MKEARANERENPQNRTRLHNAKKYCDNVMFGKLETPTPLVNKALRY